MVQPRIPVCLPKLPSAEHILPYLKRIDQNRWYSNYGPLVTEFLERTANLFSIQHTEIASASNGTLLLELCLKALSVKAGDLCVMPSWTFIATPLAAVSAGMQPLFIDVDIETHSFDPIKLEQNIPKLSVKGNIGAVIVVAPFGMPVDVLAWDRFTEKTGIPVIIDAAAAFDTILQVPQMRISYTPMMISLHATKVFGIGEGGILLSKNELLIDHIVRLTQFGFPPGIRNAESLGTNAKISEYSGAVGLASLDNWQSTRTGWEVITHEYTKLLEIVGIKHMLSSEWVTSTCNVLLPLQADVVADKLAAAGIMTRKWWGNGCHQQSALKKYPCDYLVNTEYLGKSVLGLPFNIDMKNTDINKIVTTIANSITDTNNKVYAT